MSLELFKSVKTCTADPPSYFIRVTLMRRAGEISKEREFWVHSYRMPPDSNTSIKMEVGIADCLHIEFEYKKAKCVALNNRR